MRSFRSGIIAWLAACVLLSVTVPVMATRWVGVPTSSGPVERHPTHQRVLLSQPYTQVDFENLATGTNIVGSSLSGMTTWPEPLWASVVVGSGLVADAAPASGSRAIEVSAVAGQGTGLRLFYDGAVQVAGFVAMNLNSSYHLSSYDAEGVLIHRVLMPAVPSGHRQWIGVYEGGRDFFSLRIEPTSAGRYGIDNLEYSRHSPEPSTLCLLLWTWCCMGRRISARGCFFRLHQE